MSQNSRFEVPSDSTLVAFLDGELSSADAARIEALREREPALAQRLAFLEQGCQALPDSFAPLLDAAPMPRLQAMLDGLSTANTPAPTAHAWSRRSVLAGAAACLAAGVLGDRLWRGWQGSRWIADGSWRGSVAQYMALYTEQTLEGLNQSTADQARQLARVGAQLGIVLTPARVDVPGAVLKRAQVLRYDADMLAQLVYLDPEFGPLALCFVRFSRAAEAPRTESRSGLNVVYWQDGEHAWMLAGRNPPADLLARQAAIERARA